ncbi:Gfo/Idh/MocA family protein [Polaromonas jejuensis]|uniref:Gfo/Idh/MocA family protein n=1 Tax=Polaromonas jejuensis TaxID=457502 RepID=A0ABW0QBG9_9BURK|nr:Gfo/Idh/MocA family oxidoreductase [Polaromonas jejuensis]
MKWAFVGASNIASEWMVSAVRTVGDEVVAVVSGNAERAQDFARQHGLVQALSDQRALVDLEVDAVYISNTNDRHEVAVSQAAAMGCHVLCEKPLATDLAAARRMVAACQLAGVVMSTNHHLRHNSAHRQMRDVLRHQGLGRLVAARVSHSVFLPVQLQGWRIDNPTAGGGVVMDIAVHNADSLAFLLGEYPSEVMAMTSASGMGQGVEDNAMSLWRYPSGLTAFTHQGFNTPHASNRLELLGDQASLEARGVLNQAPGGELVWRRADGNLSLRLDHDNLYVRGLREMHKAIAGEPNDMASGEAGVKSLAVALAVLESAQTGQRVPVRYD